MTIALVAHVSAASNDGNSTTTIGINTTGATLLVVVLVSYSASTQPTLTDSKSNSWTALTTRTVGGLPRETTFYCVPTSVGTGHTFSTSVVGSSFASIGVSAWSGTAATSPFDIETGNTAGPSVTTIQTGSLTPSNNNYLVIAGLGMFATSSSVTIDGGFTIMDSNHYAASQHFGVSHAYLIQTAKTAVNPTWTINAAGSFVTGVASFKPVAAAGGWLWNDVPNLGLQGVIAG